MSITAFITSVSRSCTLDKEFNPLEYMFDIGFTICDDQKQILNNGLSLSISEAPDGVIIGVDPYGRIIGKGSFPGGLNSNVKLVLDNAGVLFEATIAISTLVKVNVGEDFEFTEIQDVGGGEGGGEVVS